MSAPTLTLLAGFEASNGNNYAFYGQSTYGPSGTDVYAPDVITHDITAYGREEAGLTITRGVQQIITTGFGAQAGVLEAVLDNRDRRFDPSNLSGPYVQAGESRVVAKVPILASTSYNSIDYDLFSGYADGWPQDYPAFGHDQVVSLEATDATKLFANSNITIRRPAELSGVRIRAIVDAVGYPGPVSIASGNAMIAALTRGSVSAWSHMTDVTNAEWGDLYFAKDGTLTFRDRDQILSESRTLTSQATFGDAGTELRYSGVTRGTPPVVNRVVLTYSDTGLQVTAEDLISQARNDIQTLTLQLPFADKLQAQQYANWIIARFANPLESFASLTIVPGRGVGVTSGMNNLLPQAFGRELGDRITVKRTPLGGGSRIIADCLIRGIKHVYSGGVWRSTMFTLQDASFTTALARYDVSTYNSGDVYAL